MVDTRLELDPLDWDECVTLCYAQGYELLSDEPTTVSGPWEFWDMHPLPEAA